MILFNKYIGRVLEKKIEVWLHVIPFDSLRYTKRCHYYPSRTKQLKFNDHLFDF